MIVWRKSKMGGSCQSVLPNVAGQYFLSAQQLDGGFNVYFVPDPLEVGKASTLAEAQALAQRHYDDGGIIKFEVKP